jgi:hypothetical protein
MYEDDEDFDEYEDDGEWQPDRGECDHCFGGPPIEGPLGTLYCACEIGQGASAENCACGPEED